MKYWVYYNHTWILREEPYRTPYVLRDCHTKETYALTAYDIIDQGNGEVLIGSKRLRLDQCEILTEEQWEETRGFKDIVSKDTRILEKLPKASKQFHPFNNAIILAIRTKGQVLPQIRKQHDKRLSLLNSLRAMEGKPEKAMTMSSATELLSYFNLQLEDIFKYVIK